MVAVAFLVVVVVEVGIGVVVGVGVGVVRRLADGGATATGGSRDRVALCGGFVAAPPAYGSSTDNRTTVLAAMAAGGGAAVTIGPPPVITAEATVLVACVVPMAVAELDAVMAVAADPAADAAPSVVAAAVTGATTVAFATGSSISRMVGTSAVDGVVAGNAAASVVTGDVGAGDEAAADVAVREIVGASAGPVTSSGRMTSLAGVVVGGFLADVGRGDLTAVVAGGNCRLNDRLGVLGGLGDPGGLGNPGGLEDPGSLVDPGSLGDTGGLGDLGGSGDLDETVAGPRRGDGGGFLRAAFGVVGVDDGGFVVDGIFLTAIGEGGGRARFVATGCPAVAWP